MTAPRAHNRARIPPAAVALFMLLLSIPACGTTSPGEQQEPSPTSSSSPNADAITVTGTVVAGVEPGCLLLDTEHEQYLLIASELSGVEPGDRMVVTGTLQPDRPTTCMQGVPLRVRDAHPAGSQENSATAKAEDMTSPPLYDDGRAALDAEGVTLRRYYFPLGTNKRIPYDQIRDFEARPMGWLTGKGRGWGSAHPRYWLPLDMSRPRKNTLIVLDIGTFVRPAFSPDDPDRVIELLRARTTRNS